MPHTATDNLCCFYHGMLETCPSFHSSFLWTISGVRGLLDGVGNNITRFSRLFPVQTTVNNVTNYIRHTHSQIEDLYPEIDKMDFYRYFSHDTLTAMDVSEHVVNVLNVSSESGTNSTRRRSKNIFI